MLQSKLAMSQHYKNKFLFDNFASNDQSCLWRISLWVKWVLNMLRQSIKYWCSVRDVVYILCDIQCSIFPVPLMWTTHGSNAGANWTNAATCCKFHGLKLFSFDQLKLSNVANIWCKLDGLKLFSFIMFLLSNGATSSQKAVIENVWMSSDNFDCFLYFHSVGRIPLFER